MARQCRPHPTARPGSGSGHDARWGWLLFYGGQLIWYLTLRALKPAPVVRTPVVRVGAMVRADTEAWGRGVSHRWPCELRHCGLRCSVAGVAYAPWI